MTIPPDLGEVLAAFRLRGRPRLATLWPGGRINASFRVECGDGRRGAAYLVQRLNPVVFPDADAVMENVLRVTRRCASALEASGKRDWRRRTLTLVPTADAHWWHRDAGGACWRAFEFIEGAMARERADNPAQAREAARGFGRFLRLMAEDDGPPLHQTIPRFHDTAARFAALEDAARRDPCARAVAARAELDGLFAERALADVLPPLLGSGTVPARIAHNDAKIANVLLDRDSGEALCVIDLDTVMPGSALHDFGDLVRSLASPADEDETDLGRVVVRPAFVAALVEGYLDEAESVLTATERELLAFAGRLITLEQAVRFLTDHLEGDRYYRIAHPGQNLERAHNQLTLYRALTRHADELEAIVERSARALKGRLGGGRRP